METITDEEAKTLREIEKFLSSPSTVCLPRRGDTGRFPVSYQRKQRKLSDMEVSAYRGKIDAQKASFRLLYRKAIRLIRIDVRDAARHINPDGTVIEPYQPHIHLFSEQYSDRFAYPLPDSFTDTDSVVNLFLDFLRFSNVINVDEVKLIEQEVLFP